MSVRENVEKGEALYHVVGNVNMVIPQNTKNRTAIQPSSVSAGYVFKGIEISMSKEYLHSHVHHSTTHNCQGTESTQVSTS
jgi:hypothetical protein